MIANGPNSALGRDDAIKNVKTRKAKAKPKQASLSLPIENLEFGSKIFPNVEFPKLISLTLPIRTVSEANSQEHWTKKHRRHKKQKNNLFFAYLEIKQFVKYPCTLTFIRYAPKMLDKHDNLPMSMKWLCDAICAEITGEHRPGLADNFEGLTIKYDQVKSKQYAVKIIITF